MAANSRFAIAVHTLGVLAFVGDKPVSSELIAQSVGTNPVVIRRIMRKLVKHGLVEVRMGTGGGSSLTKPASEISLAAIYESLEEEDVFEVPALGADHSCPIGRTVRPILEQVLTGAQNEMRAYLEEISLESVLISVNEAIAAAGTNVKGR